MNNLREMVEHARLRVRLSQAQLAQKLQITQGHYSKVMSGKVPLTLDLQQKMETWLKLQSTSVTEEQIAWRMQKLASSIRSECMELMQLAGLASEAAKGQ